MVAGGEQINVAAAAEELPAAQLSGPGAMQAGVSPQVINVSIQGTAVGVHAFPPAPVVKKFTSQRVLQIPAAGSFVLEGYTPEHLALRPTPQQLERALAAPPRIRSYGNGQDGDAKQATTVFAPDQRFTFSDTAFPWSTIGRVETPGGTASGVMVGPRHLLTVSHTLQWLSDGSVGWIKFSPSYFDGSEPFGSAWGETVYYEVEVSGPDIDDEEARHDYAVVVLNTRLGDITGWMGSQTYSDSWDGSSVWSHVGYPGDLAAGQRPSYQGEIALDGSDEDPEQHQRIYHRGDVWPGQSGGPFFAWWEGESWPRVVSVQSWQNSSDNGASGGSHMIDLIVRARNEFQ